MTRASIITDLPLQMPPGLPHSQSAPQAFSTRRVRQPPHPHRRTAGSYITTRPRQTESRSGKASTAPLNTQTQTLRCIQVMDSMDWFDPGDDQAHTQVQALNRAMKIGGKVLLRSAGLKPWYTSVFEKNGFSASRVGARLPGTCIDR